MSFSSRHRFALVWLLMSALAIAVCSLILPAAHIGNEYVPVGNDSFYHARRILDTVRDPSAFYEFDSRIHAPEGSLLVWPWGYDYAMAWVVRAAMSLGLSQDPMKILAWLPAIAVSISIGLIMLIARRMSLSLGLAALAAVCVALSPLTQYLHGVGFVDHHFAEYIFVLATVWLGLRWFADPASRSAAAALGIVVGLAPAIHNGLFILQIPVVLCVFIRWLGAQRLPAAAAAWFGASLVAASVTILIPSLPFRQGQFDYYYLSWFHLYIACGTALCSISFSRYERSTRNSTLIAVGGLLLLLPLVHQMGLAGSFLTGQLLRLDAIGEMQSPLRMLADTGVSNMSNRYSLLLWLLPLTYGYCAFKVWQERQSPRLFYWVCATLGISLLLMQFRLHYFGTFALAIPLLVALQELAPRWPLLRKYLTLAATCLILLMFTPPLRNQLLGPMIVGNDPSFMNLHTSLQVLAKACRQEPGVVLADNDIGHYIRFYTECSVIADNFLLTRQHEDKIRLMEQLFSLHAADLPRTAPFVKYVLVRPAVVGLTDRGVMYGSYSRGANYLVADLLLRPHAIPPTTPGAPFELLYETNMVDGDNIDVPYLALYRIHSGTSSLVQATQ